MKTKNKILLIIGIFLILDGIFSIYFGNSCLNHCANNNAFGNLIRFLRIIGGVILVRLVI